MSFSVNMWSRCRVGLSHCLINATIWLSIIFGALPYGYNRQRRRIVPTDYSLIYSTLIDVFLIALSLNRFYKEVIANWDDLNEWSLAMLFTELANTANLNGLLVILWTNWKQYDSVLAMFNEFATLERNYFAKPKYLTHKCATFYNFLALKALVLLLKHILTIYTIYDEYGRISRYILLTYFNTAFLFNVPALPVLQFYTLVLLIYRNIWTLHRRLKHVTSCGMQRLNVDKLRHEIDEIVGVYMRLQRLSTQCNRIYGKQVLLYISAIVGNNITNAFLVLLIWKSSYFSWYVVYIVYEIVNNTVEFWLITAACQLNLNAAYDLSQLLRSFNDSAQLDDKSERELEVLALFCAMNKPQFRLGGLMKLDYSRGLSTSLNIVLHLIYLVQINYVVFYTKFDE